MLRDSWPPSRLLVIIIINQKLDGLTTLFADHKKMVSETKQETVLLSKRLDALHSFEQLKEVLESNSRASSKTKRIPVSYP